MSIDGKASGAFLSIDSWEFHVSNGLPMHVCPSLETEMGKHPTVRALPALYPEVN